MADPMTPEVPWLRKHGYTLLADIHLGVELDQTYLGFRAPLLLERYLEILDSLPGDKLLILGDLKHQIFSNTRLIRRFLEELSSRFDEVIITKGNHDGKLEEIARGLENVQIVKYFVVGRTLFAHGHARIPEDVLSSVSEIYMGHIHPALSLDYELAWISTRETIKVFLRLEPSAHAPKVVVLPTANPLLSGVNVLEFDFDVPLLKQLRIDPENFEIILPDKTRLGRIKQLRDLIPREEIN